MADAPLVFKKLPGTGGGALGRSTLWEGPDHLLLVNSWPAGESYRRFFFTDIQAIAIRRTARRMIVNFALLFLVLISVGPLLYFGGDNEGAQGTALIFGIVWLVFLSLNSLLGPTCEAHIQTAIQTEKIASMRRLRTALRVLGRIQPHILAAQPAAEAAPVAAQPTT
jgi:hypothetical protein